MPATPTPTWVNDIRQLYGDDLAFLRTFNPAMQAPYVSRHHARCFIGTAPSLARVQATYGHGTTITWLSAQLVDLVLFCGIREKPHMEQITAIAETIFVSHSHLKVTELMVFFQRFKAGDYGRFYGVIDGLVITDALNAFMPYRRQMTDHYERQQARQIRAHHYCQMAERALPYDEYELLRWYFNM